MYIFSKLVKSKFPLLSAGKKDIPILDDELILSNKEEIACNMLGGLRIIESGNGYAILNNPNNKKRWYSIEIHQDNNYLFPFDMVNTDNEELKAPALFGLAKRRLFDFTVVLTAHNPRLEELTKNVHNQIRNANNAYQEKLYQNLLDYITPRNNDVIRNLWIFGNAENLIPSQSGNIRGLGGKVIKYPQIGSVLHSLIHRRGPNFNEIYPSDYRADPDKFYINYAAPEKMVEYDEYDEILVVDGIPFSYFTGGLVNSDTYPRLSMMDIDIFLRLEFIQNTNDLFVTPLLRTSGEPNYISQIYEDLKDLGGWKIVRRQGLEPAFRNTLPGSKLPLWYTRNRVNNWFNTDPELGQIGLLQKISEGLTPVGDLSGDMTFGKVRGHLWALDSSLIASINITGTSKITGKTTVASFLAHLKNKRIFCIDYQASDKDSSISWGEKSLGTVKIPYFPDPEFKFNCPEEERNEIWANYVKQNNDIAHIWLEELFSNSRSRSEFVGLPFILRPAIDSARYIDLIRAFLEYLPDYTKEWEKDGYPPPQVLLNDVSHLLHFWGSSDNNVLQITYNTAKASFWLVNHGCNNGIYPTWIVTHSPNDLEVILKQVVYPKFSLHLVGGKEEKQTSLFDLMVPAEKEGDNVVVRRLNLRITNDFLLKEFAQMTPKETREIINRLKITDDDIPRILAEAEGWDGRP